MVSPGFLRINRYSIGTPVVTARRVETSLGVSFPAANNALARLVEMGVPVNPKGQQRNRAFVAREVIDLLNSR